MIDIDTDDATIAEILESHDTNNMPLGDVMILLANKFSTSLGGQCDVVEWQPDCREG